MPVPELRGVVTDPESSFASARKYWTDRGMDVRVTDADGRAISPLATTTDTAAPFGPQSTVVFQGSPVGYVEVRTRDNAPPDPALARFIADALERDLRTRYQIADLSKALVEEFKELSIYGRLQEMLAVRLPLAQILEMGVRQATEWLRADLGCFRLTSDFGLADGKRQIISWPTDASEDDMALKELADVVLMTQEPLLHHWPTESDADASAEPPSGQWGARLGVPIVYQGRARGALLLARQSGEHPFTTIDQRFAATVANQMAIAMENSRLLGRIRDAFFSTIIAMADAIEKRDDYTGGHTQRVAGFSLLMADGLGLSPRLRGMLHIGAMLHDVGKIGVDDAILRKQGRLTDEEFAMMKRHSTIGEEILANIPPLRDVLPVVRFHHESYDGKGYPDGLQGNEIPLLARIVAIADAFDAMTSDRPYRKGMPLAKAREEIRRCSGVQFDPNLAALFLDVEVGKLLEVIEGHTWSSERSREVLAHIDLSGVLGDGSVLGAPVIDSRSSPESNAELCPLT